MVRDEIRQAVTAALLAAQADGSLPAFDPFSVEILRPKQPEHGDYSSNVAMVAAAALRKAGANINPRLVAESIAAHVPADGPIGSVEIAGPGFINLRLSERWLQEQTRRIVFAGAQFGNIDRGNGERWQVEFVSANPTGPIHYGGARNAVLGDSLANVLEAAGYDVQREYYVNDAGTQFHLFAVTLYARYAQLLGFEVPVPEDGYQGEYMIDYARRVVEQYGDRFMHMEQADAIQALRPIGRAIVLPELETELARLGVRFDRWFSEQSLYDDGLVELTMTKLRSQGDLTERDGAVWFLASNYVKNAKDEVVIRSSGAPTYFASDIAYHYEKFVARDFRRVVNVWAVDHQGHLPRMAAVMMALGLDPARLTIVFYGLVKLIRNGEEVKMSKRKGNVLTINDVVDEVGVDPVRFNLLTRSPESAIDFDLDLAVKQSDDNPVYYVQYSHARIASILAKAANEGFEPDADPSLAQVSLLQHPSELALIRKLLELEEQVELAVDRLSPHNLTHYAIELARIYNGFYRDCRVVDPGAHELTQARLLLSQAARIGIARTLGIIGVSTPEIM